MLILIINYTLLFYKAAENEVLQPNNVIEYSDVSFAESEINEINEAIRTKVNEILDKRCESELDEGYNLALVSIPILKKEEYNL